MPSIVIVLTLLLLFGCGDGFERKHTQKPCRATVLIQDQELRKKATMAALGEYNAAVSKGDCQKLKAAKAKWERYSAAAGMHEPDIQADMDEREEAICNTVSSK